MIERELVHVATCRACRWLSLYAVRRRDPIALDAAIQLRRQHTRNDVEREAFAESRRVSRARGAQLTEPATARDRVTLSISGGSDPAINTRFPREA